MRTTTDNSQALSFWPHLTRPVRILAPMEDVTDTVFRRIIAALGRPDVFFTEFTGASGMFGPKALEVRRRLRHTAVEKPLVAQIWGNNPDDYVAAARWLRQHGFAGVDINMGCPKPKIIRRGYCSALIENRDLAKALILAAREGAGDLPVSVKTRTGVHTAVTEDWIGFLLELKPDAITVHGRTADEMSDTVCDWDEIGLAVKLRDRISPETAIIGNGDVTSLSELHQRAARYGVDGVMVGRGIFSNPALFSGGSFAELTPRERVRWMRRHFQLFRREWGRSRNYQELKKFVRVYASGFRGAEELTLAIMQSESFEQGLAEIERFLGRYECSTC
ncbi:MAG: tRNA dihydrouridine synthase [Spirochaetia bacterium]